MSHAANMYLTVLITSGCHLSKILNKRKTTAYARSLVEEGLRICAKNIGLDYERDVLFNESDLKAGLTKKEE